MLLLFNQRFKSSSNLFLIILLLVIVITTTTKTTTTINGFSTTATIRTPIAASGRSTTTITGSSSNNRRKIFQNKYNNNNNNNNPLNSNSIKNDINNESIIKIDNKMKSSSNSINNNDNNNNGIIIKSTPRRWSVKTNVDHSNIQNLVSSSTDMMNDEGNIDDMNMNMNMNTNTNTNTNNNVVFVRDDDTTRNNPPIITDKEKVVFSSSIEKEENVGIIDEMEEEFIDIGYGVNKPVSEEKDQKMSICFGLISLDQYMTQIIGKVALMFAVFSSFMYGFYRMFHKLTVVGDGKPSLVFDNDNDNDDHQNLKVPLINSSPALVIPSSTNNNNLKNDYNDVLPTTVNDNNNNNNKELVLGFGGGTFSFLPYGFYSFLSNLTPGALWASYMSVLNAYPLITKMITASIIMGFADWTGQQLEISQKKSNNYSVIKHEIIDEAIDYAIDWSRVMRFALMGLLLQAPWTHFFFQRLDMALPPTPGNPFSLTNVFKVLIDQFINSPIFTLVIFIFLGVLEGKTLLKIKNQVALIYGETMIASWWVFIPVTIVNFAFCPPQLRTLFINVVFFFWSIYLSLKINDG